MNMLLSRGGFDWIVLGKAVANTFRNRHSNEHIANWRKILTSVSASEKMQSEWNRYRKNAPYANDISFAEVVNSVATYLERISIG